MDELLNRLREIRSRAAEIAKFDVIDEDARAELRALRDERVQLEAKIADAEIIEQLSADVPEYKAEAGGEDTPADTDAEDTPVDDGEGDDAAPAEGDVAPAQEAIAAAVSNTKPADTTLTPSGADTGLVITASSTAYGMRVGEKMQVDDWQRVFRFASNQNEGRHVFASIDRSTGKKVVSSRNSAIDNTIIMAQPQDDDAPTRSLTAAACYCGPFETNKEIQSLGVDDRPVAGLFRAVPVTGPFKYVRDLSLAAVNAGVTLWDCADQAAVDPNTPSTWKPCVDLTCLTEYTVTPHAIPACGRFSVFQQVSHPELIDDLINKLGIVYARRAEQALLDAIRADNTVLTYGIAGMGLLHELTGVLGHLSGLSGYVRRIDWKDYALILPPGMLDALVADEHRRGFSRGANRADIIQQLKDLGVGQVVEARDADTTAEADYTTAHGVYVSPGGTVAFNPCTAIGTWTAHIVPVNAYTRGESVLVEAGFERDSSISRQNTVQWFMEGHEFLEKMTPDVPGFTIELTSAGTGGSSALVTPEAC